MLSEVIFHCTWESNTIPSEFSNFLDELNIKMSQHNLVGCSAIHEEEMIHLIQGNNDAICDLFDFVKKISKIEDVTVIDWESIPKVEYDVWQVFWENETIESKVKVIDKRAFLRNYVLNKNRIFTPFHHVVRGVFKEPILG